jgi:hypothetical protein
MAIEIQLPNEDKWIHVGETETLKVNVCVDRLIIAKDEPGFRIDRETSNDGVCFIVGDLRFPVRGGKMKADPSHYNGTVSTKRKAFENALRVVLDNILGEESEEEVAA